MLFANDMIDVTPSDALQTLKTFRFNTEFVEHLTEEQNEINALGQYKFCMADPTIKSDFLKREDVIDAFVHIIIDNYTEQPIPTPEIIQENKIELLEETNKEVELIKELFLLQNIQNMYYLLQNSTT